MIRIDPTMPPDPELGRRLTIADVSPSRPLASIESVDYRGLRVELDGDGRILAVIRDPLTGMVGAEDLAVVLRRVRWDAP